MAFAIRDRLLGLFFPHRCVLCTHMVAYDSLWCGACPLPFTESAAEQTAAPLSGCIAPFFYTKPTRQAVLRLKERDDARTAAFFAQYMYEAVLQCGVQFDAIVPVPMHPSRLRQRGYNQAERLALPLGKRLDLPVFAHALIRSDATRVQHGLSYSERLQNAAQSYHSTAADALGGCTVLLVDDVYTTGATAQVCAQCLLDMGAAAVWAVTATRVPRTASGR